MNLTNPIFTDFQTFQQHLTDFPQLPIPNSHLFFTTDIQIFIVSHSISQLLTVFTVLHSQFLQAFRNLHKLSEMIFSSHSLFTSRTRPLPLHILYTFFSGNFTRFKILSLNLNVSLRTFQMWWQSSRTVGLEIPSDPIANQRRHTIAVPQSTRNSWADLCWRSIPLRKKISGRPCACINPFCGPQSMLL